MNLYDLCRRRLRHLPYLETNGRRCRKRLIETAVGSIPVTAVLLNKNDEVVFDNQVYKELTSELEVSPPVEIFLDFLEIRRWIRDGRNCTIRCRWLPVLSLDSRYAARTEWRSWQTDREPVDCATISCHFAMAALAAEILPT